MITKKEITRKKNAKNAKGILSKKSSKISKEEKTKIIKQIIDNELSVGDTLTIKQELFCQNYVQNAYYRGNGTHSYAAAYDIDLASKDRTRQTDSDGKEISGTSERDRAELSCAVMSSNLLRNIKIQLRCRELTLEMKTNDVIDARMMKIIIDGTDQNAISAIKEYNALNQRIEKKISMNVITETDRDSLLSKLSEVEKLDE